MTTFITIILFFAALVLVILVLAQPDRSQGMSSAMGTGASNSVFGISKDGGPLAKGTKIVATVFVVAAFMLYIFS
ncbi:MAG: preprotein translocase subunit SecG [Fusobacteriaceae bacterium]